MPYLGNVPAEAYTNTVKDSFNGDGSTTAFTLSQPSTTNNLRVVVENVIQDPTVAYSCSGTTLTFTSAPPSGTANIYAVHLGPSVQTVVPPDGVTVTDLNAYADGATAFTANRATSNGDIFDLQKDGTTVGRIGSYSGNAMYVMAPNDGGCGLLFSDNANPIYPIKNVSGVATLSDGYSALGAAVHRFTNLYLSGGVYLGGTGSDNLLDDVEYGSWTPSVGGNATYNAQTGKYTKIGNQVTCWFNIYVSSIGTGSATTVTGLPYTVSNITEFNANGNSMTYWASTAAAYTYLAVKLDKNTTQFQFTGTTTSTTTSGTLGGVSVYGNGTDSYGTFTYRTG